MNQFELFCVVVPRVVPGIKSTQFHPQGSDFGIHPCNPKPEISICSSGLSSGQCQCGESDTFRRLRLKSDGTRAETRFRLSAKRTSPFKSAGASESTTGSRDVCISSSNAGYSMFRGSVRSTGYPLHSPVSPSLLLPCVTVCHHISTGLY